jgi:hypothetical protein
LQVGGGLVAVVLLAEIAFERGLGVGIVVLAGVGIIRAGVDGDGRAVRGGGFSGVCALFGGGGLGFGGGDARFELGVAVALAVAPAQREQGGGQQERDGRAAAQNGRQDRHDGIRVAIKG